MLRKGLAWPGLVSESPQQHCQHTPLRGQGSDDTEVWGQAGTNRCSLDLPAFCIDIESEQNSFTSFVFNFREIRFKDQRIELTKDVGV